MKLSRMMQLAILMGAVCLSGGAQPAANPTKIFQIGIFDGASTEFRGGEPSYPVTFIVGQSDSAKDWYGSQPAAPLASSSGPEAKTPSGARAIQFSIPDAPAPAYRLHIALQIESRSLPALQVGINGKHGTFYPQSKLDSHMGGMDDVFESFLGSVDLVFDFPGSYLHQGSNTITLQAVQQEEPSVSGASLTYDAIELDSVQAAALPAESSSAQILPTVFYQRRGTELDELVDVFIRHDQPSTLGGSLDFTLAGKHYRQPFHGEQDFGEEKLEFSVPEFSPQTLTQLTWTIGGQQSHKEQSIDPQNKWTLLIVPHIHLDVGFSDYQAKVAAIQSRAMDEAMDFTAQHSDFRFSVDGSWSLDQFLKTRSPADQQRAIAAMQKRQLFVPAEYANLLTGFPTAETLIRSLYPSANFSRTHGTPFNYANITDVPSYSWSYSSILASAGIKYLIAGPNGHEAHAPVLLHGRLNENSPFWWQGPDGKKVLFWYARHYWEMGILFGLPPSIPAGRETLPMFLQAYEHPGFHANSVIAFGSQVENTDLLPQQAEFAQQWNNVYAYPRLQYSGFYQAITEIERQFGNNIPTVSGDGGPYWEDGIASDARLAAMERRNESRGPAAEELATLTSLVNPRLAADKVDLDRMWTNMVLMDEHTWTSHDAASDPTSDESVRQSAVKRQYAANASAIADFVARNCMASLADSISAGRGSLIVFNTLNWKRTGFVSFDLNRGDEIVDPSTRRAIPVEVISESRNLRHVRFVAPDVPATGYKVFQLRPGEGSISTPEVSHATTVESPYYRVELDPATGAIRSIYDKDLRRELVNRQSPYRFGQYLYVAGGDRRPNSLVQYRALPNEPALRVTGAQAGRIVSVTRTPYGWSARMESTDTNTPAIATEVRLFDHQKKIELVEDVDKQYVTSKEAVYFAFPFVMDRPQFQYEIQTGVVDPARNMYPGAGQVWFSVQHWISVQQDGLSATVMPLDAPLATFGDIHRGLWPSEFGVRPGTVFSYVMNNYWGTNYNAGQGGHFRFRYVIVSAPSTDAPGLSRMGWEEVTGLEHDQVTSQDKAQNLPRPWDGKQGTFLTVQDPDLLLESWKPAEDTRGTILRFLDLAGTVHGAARTVTVQIPLLHLTGAVETDAVERDRQRLPLVGAHGFKFTVRPHEIVTVRLLGQIEVGGAAFEAGEKTGEPVSTLSSSN